jgi:hypothetical protein
MSETKDEPKSNKRKTYEEEVKQSENKEVKLTLRKNIRNGNWRLNSLKIYFLDYIGDISQLEPAKRIMDLKDYLHKRLFPTNDMDV